MRPSISTRTGDQGQTGLFGGKRVSKNDPRLHAYGTIDELNAVLGVILAEHDLPQEYRDDLHTIQQTLFIVGADLATPLEEKASVPRLEEKTVTALEHRGAVLEKELPTLTHFILPGGSRTGALLHQARTVCRRAERWIVALMEHEQINPHVRVYINRLSDFLFLLSRTVNLHAGAREELWQP